MTSKPVARTDPVLSVEWHAAVRMQVDIRAALERHEAGQREVLHMLRALAVEVQQQEQPKEQQEQQAEFSQPLASTLAAYNDPKTLQSSVPIISPLQMTCEQFMKRAPRLMDYVRIRKPGEYDNAEGVVLGSSRCGTRLKVRHCRTRARRHGCSPPPVHVVELLLH